MTDLYLPIIVSYEIAIQVYILMLSNPSVYISIKKVNKPGSTSVHILSADSFPEIKETLWLKA